MDNTRMQRMVNYYNVTGVTIFHTYVTELVP